MTTRTPAWTALAIVLATAGALLQTPAQPATPRGVVSVLPGGAVLVVQAKDFGSILADWNGSGVKSAWLSSASYQAFSRSRLFLRLEEAQKEFATAAGAPPDMALVSDVAGSESALAIYDIGKLEFLYVTRLPSAKTMENALWRTRGRYQPREAAGTPFYVRTDPESKRTVTFAVRDQFLLLATRDDLVAGALTLIAGRGGQPVESDGWFAQAVRAAAAPGDLRLVANLTALVRQPHFRSYWVQENVGELRQFSAAVSDLTRTAGEIREERILLRVDENARPPEPSPAIGEIVRLVPDSAGLYRAWANPAGDAAAALAFEKVIATSAAASVASGTAPRAGSIAARAGGDGDLESRIDEEPRAPASPTYDMEPLARLIGEQPLSAMLHVESSRAAADGVFADSGSVVVLARSTPWPQNARDAVRAVVEPVWTKARLGMRWLDSRSGAQTFSQLEGLDALAVAVRGPLLFLSNDPALLAAVLDGAARPAAPLQASYAAGFRHALERDRFARLVRFVDRSSPQLEGLPPPFFSENVASFSASLSRVASASIVVRDRGATMSQTVTYGLSR